MINQVSNSSNVTSERVEMVRDRLIDFLFVRVMLTQACYAPPLPMNPLRNSIGQKCAAGADHSDE